MACTIYFYLFFFINRIDESFSDADHVLTADTSFSIFTPWSNPNAVNTVLLELPKDKKRAAGHDNLPQEEDQIIIRIRIGPSHNVGPVEKYLVINDIYDPKRQTKDKALAPYVIEVRRGEPVITYSLDYIEDVKFNDYNQHSSRSSKKNSQQASASTKKDDATGVYEPSSSKQAPEKEYKPAMDRLNAVMKKLTAIFETETKRPDVDAVFMNDIEESERRDDNKMVKELLLKENPATQKTESKKLKELNDVIESRKPGSISLPFGVKYPYNGHQMESSCLKRHAFENWKNQKAFNEHSANSKSKKHANDNVRNFNGPPHLDKASDHVSNSLKSQNLLDQQYVISPNGELCDKSNANMQPMREARGSSSNQAMSGLYERLHDNSNDQFSEDNLRLKETPKTISGVKLEDVDEKELLRLLRSALEPLEANPTESKPHKSKQRLTRATFAGVSNGNQPASQGSTKQRSFRKKRSILDSDSHRYYKNEDSLDSDQCDRNKMFHDNEFDLQSCDNCGGKSKKPQKPPHNSNVRVAQKRRADFENKAVRPDEVLKSGPCLCRTHQSACICGTGKKFRSHHDPVHFSMFGLNSPTAFVTSRIRIFRKRRGIWWEVAPPTNLNSMAGVYSDGNFSFSFSSPIELFQLEKALRLQDQQLLFPTFNKAKHSDESHDEIPAETIDADNLDSKAFNRNPSLVMTMNKKATVHKKSVPELRPLTDFGFFPTTMNAIEKCPYDDKQLCLNMLTDEAPASTFKVQMPFQDNVLIHKNMIRIQISNIITDATTQDAMQISVLVINKGVQSRMVALNIKNCPTLSDTSLPEAKTMVQKMLFPNIAETATFLLPLIQQSTAKSKKFECLVEVSTKISDSLMGRAKRRQHNVGMKVVSKRKFLVEPEKRCLCIWHCACHCIPKLISHSDYKMCQKMSASERKQAGFPRGSGQGYFDQDSQSAMDIFLSFIRYASFLLFLMLLLGLIKALLGLIIIAIDRWAFDYVYPNPNYNCSTRARRFFGNVFIFVIFPFRFLCTCFTPSPEDLLVASSEWQCCQTQGAMCEDEFDEPDLLQTGVSQKKTQNSSKSKQRLSSGIEVKQQELSKRLSRLSLAFQQEVTDEENGTRRAPKSASEIVKTLSERRDQRRKSRQNLPSTSAAAARDILAQELVQSLLDAKRVYRTIREPIGNVSKIPHGVKYCIQGYFIATLDTGFEFVSFQPLVQYRGIAAETFHAKELHPPIFLSSSAFNRRYSNEIAVLKSGDITVQPPENVPCINVRVIDDATDTETSSATSNQREVSRPSLKRFQR